jgi:putative transposase
VKRAYRFRFYPTGEQAAVLSRTFGCVRVVWNDALRHRTDAWFDRQERVNYNATSARLTALKKAEGFEWLNEVSSVPLQQALRHQQTAFSNFFAKRAGYPTFKSKHAHRDSAEFTTSAFRWDQDGQSLTLAKMVCPLAIRLSRHVPAAPSTVTVTRDPAGRWHVSLLVEDDTVSPLPARTETVGVDLGIASFCALSTGEKIVNPKYQDRDLAKLVRAQRDLARKQKGSANHRKAARRVARIHATIADRRRDHLHQLSTRLVRENQTIVVEDLNVRGMVANRKLARAISDCGWSEFRRQLTYKADWYGRELVVIDRWFPSTRRCSNCGHIGPRHDLSVREWTCSGCHAIHDRDINAAINIRAAGLAVQACGEGVRPVRAQHVLAVLGEAGTPESDLRNPRP